MRKLIDQKQPIVLREGNVIQRFIQEVRFCTERKWRFDYVLADCDFQIHRAKVAIEIEGGVFRKGGGCHQRAGRFLSDMEKYNEAAIMGWKVLRFPAFVDEDIFCAVKRIIKDE